MVSVLWDLPRLWQEITVIWQMRPASVVTAGAAQKPGETRLDLVQKNAKIMTSVIEQINAIDYKGILLIVSNPVDILTAVAQKVSNLPAKRIVGSGTTLDTARLKHKLGEHLSVDEP